MNNVSSSCSQHSHHVTVQENSVRQNQRRSEKGAFAGVVIENVLPIVTVEGKDSHAETRYDKNLFWFLTFFSN